MSNNETFKLPLTRDDLTITFHTTKYLNTLKACERNLSKLNIPFNELYTSNSSSHTLNSSLNIILNPKLYQQIKSHISNIDQFVEYNLLDQKSKLSNKIINNLIKCEQESKTDLHLSLLNNKALLCTLHNITNEIEHLLQTFTTVTTHNKQLISTNIALIRSLSTENQREATITNNIAYYKANIRKLKSLYQQQRTLTTTTTTDVLSQFDYMKQLQQQQQRKHRRNVCKINNYITQYKNEHDVTMSNTNTKCNTFYGSNVLTSFGNVSRRSEEDDHVFRNESEKMKKKAKMIYKKMRLLNCERSKLYERENKGDNIGDVNEIIFNKVGMYIDKAKKRFGEINKRYCNVYRKERMISSVNSVNVNVNGMDSNISDDEGFRRLFMEMLVKDEDVQRIVDKNLGMTVTRTRKVLNMKKYHNNNVNE